MRGARTSKDLAKPRLGQWEQFTQRYGAQCQVRWNGATGVPERILASGIHTGLRPDASDKVVESWARSFVEANKGLLGIGSEGLRLLDLRRAGGRLYVTFHQVEDGLPVYQAFLKMNVDKKGNLALISSSCYPDVEYRPTTKLSPQEAARMVVGRISGTKKAGTKFALLESEKVLYPMIGEKSEPFRVCYLLKIHLNEPLGRWVVVVDGSRGTEYVRYNDYRFGSVYGNVTGEVLPAYEGETPVTMAFEGEGIHVLPETPVYGHDLSTNPGWSVTGAWAWGTPTGRGGDAKDVGPFSGHTGSTVYGYNLNGGYSFDIPTTYYVTTPAFDCSSLTGTHLSFWQWLGVEMREYDEAVLEVSNDGSSWVPIWENWLWANKESREWERVVYDISSIADGHSTVYVRWGIGPTDETVVFAGWYIDDIAIYANGGTGFTSGSGDYSVTYAGTGNVEVYAEMSGPYGDVRFEDGPRIAYTATVPSGSNSWSWTAAPPLTTLQTWDLNSDPGWTVGGAWEHGTPLGNDGDPTSGHTGSNVYGYNLAGSYPNNIGTTMYLTMPTIDFSSYSNTYLRFWRWLGVEAGAYDYAAVELANGSTSYWSRPYTNLESWDVNDTEWTQVTYDISGYADGQSTVRIRWGLGPTDLIVNSFGWNIDDIEIAADLSGSDVRRSLRDFDEVNVFHHMGVARNSIKSIEPGFTGMDYQVPGVVRIRTEYANAFWDGEGINFGEGDGYLLENLALYADVIYHEYNHGITDQIYPGSMLPYIGESGALDEAWSDYFACNITGEPMVGEGGLVIGEPFMRNLDNTLRVPDDWAGEVHDDGRIVGGAMWDLRESLGAVTASNLLHFARYNLAETFMDYYEDVLVTDDDNSNLNDGTPNMPEIAEAFGNHGIGGLQVVQTAKPVTEPVNANGKVDAGETGNLLALLKAYFVPTNVQVTLGSTSPFVQVLDALSEYGDFSYGQEKHNVPDPMSFKIGWGCPDDEILDLILSITADGGFSATWPLTIINAPDQILYDDGEPTDYIGTGWASDGFAVRFTPRMYPVTITSVRLWPDAYSSGVEIDLHAWDDDGPGGSPGTELMEPKLVQVAGSDTWEEFSVGAMEYEVIYEWNMDTNPGWTSEGGWAFGTPTGGGGEYGSPDPTSGATGSNVYGYNLSGDYPHNMSTTEYLTTGPIDCSSLSTVYLQFQRWLGVEDSMYDHASIDVSNNGSTWTPVWENVYEVSDDDWATITRDLTSVAAGESTVYIRWGMGPTDSSYAFCGWNIDDVKILEGHEVGGGIVVTSGDIYLGWIETDETYYNGATFSNSDQRSWVHDMLASEWLQLDAEGYPMDFLVRARYSQGVQTGVAEWTSYR